MKFWDNGISEVTRIHEDLIVMHLSDVTPAVFQEEQVNFHFLKNTKTDDNVDVYETSSNEIIIVPKKKKKNDHCHDYEIKSISKRLIFFFF